MATTIANNQLDLDAFLSIQEDDEINFRGSVVFAGPPAWTNGEDGVEMRIPLIDADERQRGEMVKLVGATDPDYAATVAALEG